MSGKFGILTVESLAWHDRWTGYMTVQVALLQLNSDIKGYFLSVKHRNLFIVSFEHRTFFQ